MTACIVGWAHTKFGKLEGEDAESLIVRVAGDALHDAGVAPGDVDAIYMGFYNGGFSAQDFAASLALQADEHLRFKPSTRVENARSEERRGGKGGGSRGSSRWSP